jgi:hypothetical protein
LKAEFCGFKKKHSLFRVYQFRGSEMAAFFRNLESKDPGIVKPGFEQNDS